MFYVEIAHENMEYFSLEDEDYDSMFITQEPRDNVGQDVIKSDEEEGDSSGF